MTTDPLLVASLVKAHVAEIRANHAASLAAHGELMARLEATADAARIAGLRVTKQVERVTELARLVGIRLASIEREIAQVLP
jgi:hypothetical protein